MTKLYHILGVSQTASSEEIRRAYRKAAASAHPDKGGDDEKMAEINRAYEILSDPARRARYDTGKDDLGARVFEAEVEATVVALFAEAIDAVNPLQFCVERVKQQQAKFASASAQGLHQINGLQAKLKKVKRRDGDESRNVFRRVLEQRIAKVKSSLEEIAIGVEVATAVAERLRDYESGTEEEPDLLRYGFTRSYSGSSTTGSW